MNNDLQNTSTKTLLTRLRSWEMLEHGPAWLVEGKDKVIAELRAELERRGEMPDRTETRSE